MKKQKQAWAPPMRPWPEETGLELQPTLFVWKWSGRPFVQRPAENGLILVGRVPVISVGTDRLGGFWLQVRNWDTLIDPTRMLSQFTGYTDALWCQLTPTTPARKEAWAFFKKHAHIWEKHRDMAAALVAGDVRGCVAKNAAWSLFWDMCVAKGAPLFKEFRKQYPEEGAFYDNFMERAKEQP